MSNAEEVPEAAQIGLMLTNRGIEIERVVLSKRSYIVGRATSCDIHCPFAGVSRIHAEIAFIDDKWQIQDLNSRYGMLLNFEEIAQSKFYDLSIGSRINLGGLFSLTVITAAEARPVA